MKKKIPWEDASEKMSEIVKIDRTYFKYKGIQVSVVNGFGTYGGYGGANRGWEEKDNEGLLEVMVWNKDVVGWLTAKEVLKFVKESIK